MGDRVLQKVLARVFLLITLHRKSTLGSTFWSTPISHSTLGSTFRSTPISEALARALPGNSRLAPPWLAVLIVRLEHETGKMTLQSLLRTRFAIPAAIYRGAKCPTLKNSRKTAEEGAEWVTATAEKQPEEQRKDTKNSCFDSFGCFPAVLRLLYRDPLGTFFGCFSGVFNVGHLAPL